MSAAESAALTIHDVDFYSISRDHLLSTITCTYVNDPGAPAPLQFPKYEMHAHVLYAMTIDNNDNAVMITLKGSNILCHELRTEDVSIFLLEAGLKGHLSDTVESASDLATRTMGDTSFDDDTRAVEDLHGSNVYAAVAACPAELRYLLNVTWHDLYVEGERCNPERPCCLLALITLMLGSRGRNATRTNDASPLRLMAETLRRYVQEWAALPLDASDANVASQVAPYLGTIYGVIPQWAMMTHTDPAAMRAYLRDAHTLLTGTKAAVDSTLWRLLHLSLHHFVVLGEFQTVLKTVGETKLEFQRLMNTFIPGVEGDVWMKWEELERELARLGKRSEIVELRNSGSDGRLIIDTIIDSYALVTRGGGNTSSKSRSADDENEGSAIWSSLGDDAIATALSQKTFRDAVTLAGGQTGIEFLETCFLAGSTIISRYLMSPTSAIAKRHHFFSKIDSERKDMLAYFSRALALDPTTGNVREGLEEYEWDEKQMKLLIDGKWLEMDMVNWPGGYLEFVRVENNKRYHYVQVEGHYVTESTLQGVCEFATRLVLALGYPAVPYDDGYSLKECCDAQLGHTRYIDALPSVTLKDKREWSAQNFRRNVIKRAASNYLDILNSHNPADVVFNSFLDSNTPYFGNIAQQRRSAAPIVAAQKAFPDLLPNDTSTVPGAEAFTTDDSGGGSSSGWQIDKRGDYISPKYEGGGVGGDGGKGKGKQKRGEKGGKGGGAGSTSNLAKWVSDTDLFLAGRVYDVAAIAKHCGCALADKCWPVLLSSKQGDLRMTLCPDSSNHGGINAKKHKAPTKFDRAHIEKTYSQLASITQREKAGWKPASKKSKK